MGEARSFDVAQKTGSRPRLSSAPPNFSLTPITTTSRQFSMSTQEAAPGAQPTAIVCVGMAGTFFLEV